MTSNKFTPAREHLLAGVAIPTRKDALVLSVLSINHRREVVDKNVVAVVRSCFVDTMCWIGEAWSDVIMLRLA